MNFEVFCFDYVDESIQVVQKEYFDTYAEALKFEQGEGKKYECGVSITPMNKEAEDEMRCIQCGGGDDCHYCVHSDLYIDYK